MFIDGNRSYNNNNFNNGGPQQSGGGGFWKGLLKCAAIGTGIGVGGALLSHLFMPFGFGMPFMGMGMMGMGMMGLGGLGCGLFNYGMPMGSGAAAVNMFCSGSPFTAGTFGMW